MLSSSEENNREAHNVDVLTKQNEELQNRVNELTALLYRMSEHFDTKSFNRTADSLDDQNLARNIKQRLRMTPEVWDIVNRSREQQQPADSP